MAKININSDKCKGCLLCISFCPKGLIAIDIKLNQRGVKPAKFSCLSPEAGKENTACLGCAMCAIICPDCCIEVYK